jgi:hypothetical protein
LIATWKIWGVEYRPKNLYIELLCIPILNVDCYLHVYWWHGILELFFFSGLIASFESTNYY